VAWLEASITMGMMENFSSIPKVSFFCTYTIKQMTKTLLDYYNFEGLGRESLKEYLCCCKLSLLRAKLMGELRERVNGTEGSILIGNHSREPDII
jgi:hypothetical protein